MKSVAARIDHTLLKPDATAIQISNLCKEALHYGFASVCVNPFYVPLVAANLRQSQIKTCTVIGFPLGATSTLSKVFEARDAIAAGATELDMVMNISAAKEGDWRTVEDDIAAVANALPDEIVLKVIIETFFLTEQEKTLACLVAQKAGADYIKTCTGFSGGTATIADLLLIKRTVPSMKIKASGGIRDLATVKIMLDVGADRIGCSASVAIAEEELQNSECDLFSQRVSLERQ